MKKRLHVKLLLGAAVALFILDETEVSCGVIVVQSSSSSSSRFGTWCDGLHCPPGSNCMAFSKIINGNGTTDKRCTNIYGKVVRQETVTIANGEICLRNLTMVGRKVNVEQSCRKLSKTQLNNMDHQIQDHLIHATVLDSLELEQDALEDVLEQEEQQREWWHEKLERDRELETEAIDRVQDQKDILDDLQEKLHQIATEVEEDLRERQAEARQEQLEQEVEAMEKFLEIQHKAKLF